VARCSEQNKTFCRQKGRLGQPVNFTKGIINTKLENHQGHTSWSKNLEDQKWISSTKKKMHIIYIQCRQTLHHKKFKCSQWQKQPTSWPQLYKYLYFLLRKVSMHDSNTILCTRIWRLQMKTLQHPPMTPSLCSTMKDVARMQVHSAPSTLLAQDRIKTMTSSTSGAHALRSWLTCMEEERIKSVSVLQ